MEEPTLLRWLTGRGARAAPLAIAPDPLAGRAVVAAADIADGSAVLSVPRPLLLTTDVARASAAGRALGDATEHALLAAYLLHERRDAGSSLRPYLDALPASFPTCPLFYGDDDLALLRGSYVLDRLADLRGTLAQDHDAIRRLPASSDLSFAEYAWARTVISSRVFGITVAGTKTEALVPVADMMNHRRPPDVRWTFDDEAGAFVMTATRDLRAGEPVHDSYGKKSNGRFLLSYGFVLDDGDDDEAAIRVAVPPGDPAFARKVALGGERRTFPIPARLDDDRARRALSFLRVAHASEGELRWALSGACFDPQRGMSPINARSEAAVMSALAAACEEALARFDTTIEEDDALLQDGNLGPIGRACVIVRRGEKRVLAGLRDLARAALPVLHLPWQSLVRAVDERAAGEGEVDGYLRSVVASLAGPRSR